MSDKEFFYTCAFYLTVEAVVGSAAIGTLILLKLI
jgi:hypothetical protein